MRGERFKSALRRVYNSESSRARAGMDGIFASSVRAEPLDMEDGI